MKTLFVKELQNFFSSLIGYLVLAIFLLINGLFLFVLPGEFNVLESGYANIDGLFILAPWIFLFLIPAISMRFFSEEIKSGTMELLLTMPISNVSITLGKFFAGLVLLFFALCPTILYYVTVFSLGSPLGNIDSGACIGAYIGLFFLGGLYLAVGLLISSFTSNQIVAFIVSAAICFLLYFGFDAIAQAVPRISFVSQFGIADHYASISRGVIDLRDIIYFVGSIVFILYCTTISVEYKRK